MSDQNKSGLARMVNVDDVKWDEWKSPKGRVNSRIRSLGVAAGSERIGFDIQVIPAGTSSCPLHFHMAQEEFFMVMDGRGTLREWQDGEFREAPIKKGDVLSYPAGHKIAHEFVNNSDGDLTLFVAGERTTPEVVYYPDSDKWGVTGMKGRVREQGLDYWDAEDD